MDAGKEHKIAEPKQKQDADKKDKNRGPIQPTKEREDKSKDEEGCPDPSKENGSLPFNMQKAAGEGDCAGKKGKKCKVECISHGQKYFGPPPLQMKCKEDGRWGRDSKMAFCMPVWPCTQGWIAFEDKQRNSMEQWYEHAPQEERDTNITQALSTTVLSYVVDTGGSDRY